MQNKPLGPKSRVRYWKKMLKVQSETKGKDYAGKPLPSIKKGDKKYQMIMELARVPPPELISIAKKYYKEDITISQMLKWYSEGSLRQEHKKEGRKRVPITVGFPKGSKFVAQMIRYRIINIERGMTRIEKEKTKVIRVQKKKSLSEVLKKHGYSDEAIAKMNKKDMLKVYNILIGDKK